MNQQTSNLINIRVDEYTTPCPISVTPTTSVAEVKRLMQTEGVRHVPVMDGKKAIGILSERDVRVISNMALAEKYTAQDLMSPDPYLVVTGTCLDEVVFEMSKNKIGSALIQDQEGEVIGIFTSIDALNALLEILRGELPDYIK